MKKTGVLIQFVYLIILALANNFLLKRFPDQSIAVTSVIFAVSVFCGIITVKIFGSRKNRGLMIFAAIFISLEIITPLLKEFLMLI